MASKEAHRCCMPQGYECLHPNRPLDIPAAILASHGPRTVGAAAAAGTAVDAGSPETIRRNGAGSTTSAPTTSTPGVMGLPPGIIAMQCSNEKCPLSHFAHLECFDRLEEELLRLLERVHTRANVHKWKDHVRESMLWTKYYDMVYKHCRCPCANGYLMRHPDDRRLVADLTKLLEKEKEKEGNTQHPADAAGESGKQDGSSKQDALKQQPGFHGEDTRKFTNVLARDDDDDDEFGERAAKRKAQQKKEKQLREQQEKERQRLLEEEERLRELAEMEAKEKERVRLMADELARQHQEKMREAATARTATATATATSASVAPVSSSSPAPPPTTKTNTNATNTNITTTATFSPALGSVLPASMPTAVALSLSNPPTAQVAGGAPIIETNTLPPSLPTQASVGFSDYGLESGAGADIFNAEMDQLGLEDDNEDNAEPVGVSPWGDTGSSQASLPFGAASIWGPASNTPARTPTLFTPTLGGGAPQPPAGGAASAFAGLGGFGGGLGAMNGVGGSSASVFGSGPASQQSYGSTSTLGSSVGLFGSTGLGLSSSSASAFANGSVNPFGANASMYGGNVAGGNVGLSMSALGGAASLQGMSYGINPSSSSSAAAATGSLGGVGGGGGAPGLYGATMPSPSLAPTGLGLGAGVGMSVGMGGYAAPRIPLPLSMQGHSWQAPANVSAYGVALPSVYDVINIMRRQ